MIDQTVLTHSILMRSCAVIKAPHTNSALELHGFAPTVLVTCLHLGSGQTSSGFRVTNNRSSRIRPCWRPLRTAFEMPKLLFIHKDSPSASLSGSNNDKERALINSHVQGHRKHLRKTNLQLKPTSLRPKFPPFQRKRDIEITQGSTTLIADSNRENDLFEEFSSGDRSDDQEEPPKEDFRLFEDPFFNDDWTANMVSAGSQRLVDVRQHNKH